MDRPIKTWEDWQAFLNANPLYRLSRAIYDQIQDNDSPDRAVERSDKGDENDEHD
jgi:hypothetical protein